ncbi:hypothetical protein GVAV_001043 [Gurleya vavrai]
MIAKFLFESGDIIFTNKNCLLFRILKNMLEIISKYDEKIFIEIQNFKIKIREFLDLLVIKKDSNNQDQFARDVIQEWFLKNNENTACKFSEKLFKIELKNALQNKKENLYENGNKKTDIEMLKEEFQKDLEKQDK